MKRITAILFDVKVTTFLAIVLFPWPWLLLLFALCVGTLVIVVTGVMILTRYFT